MKTFKLRLNMFEINHFLRVLQEKYWRNWTYVSKIILAKKNE